MAADCTSQFGVWSAVVSACAIGLRLVICGWPIGLRAEHVLLWVLCLCGLPVDDRMWSVCMVDCRPRDGRLGALFPSTLLQAACLGLVIFTLWGSFRASL